MDQTKDNARSRHFLISCYLLWIVYTTVIITHLSPGKWSVAVQWMFKQKVFSLLIKCFWKHWKRDTVVWATVLGLFSLPATSVPVERVYNLHRYGLFKSTFGWQCNAYSIYTLVYKAFEPKAYSQLTESSASVVSQTLDFHYQLGSRNVTFCVWELLNIGYVFETFKTKSGGWFFSSAMMVTTILWSLRSLIINLRIDWPFHHLNSNYTLLFVIRLLTMTANRPTWRTASTRQLFLCQSSRIRTCVLLA